MEVRATSMEVVISLPCKWYINVQKCGSNGHSSRWITMDLLLGRAAMHGLALSTAVIFPEVYPAFRACLQRVGCDFCGGASVRP